MTPTDNGASPRQQRLLAAARAVDLAMLALVDGLAVDALDEVPTDALLAVDAALGSVERRRLHTVARVLPHLPSLRAAVEDGRASFDLAARICRTCSSHRLTAGHLALLDDVLGLLLSERRDADDVADAVVDHVVALRPDTAEAWEAVADDRVSYSPDLFGGGRVHVEATATTYPVITGAIDHVMTRDGLLDARDLLPHEERDDTAFAHNDGVLGSARAAALLTMSRETLAGRSADGAARPPRPSLQVVVPLDALTGDTNEPARLLTGGRMTAGTVRRLVQHEGADVTAIVVGRADNMSSGRPATAPSSVVGVGRRTRVAPDWLDRLTRALHPRCVMPGCRVRTSASSATDLDHATRWADGGATDLDNLARLCRRHHVAKDADRTWRLAPDDTGSVLVTHVPSGWSATTRPPGTGPPAVARTAAEAARPSSRPRLPRAPSTRSRPPPTGVGGLPF